MRNACGRVGTSLDFLIVGAISSVKLSALGDNIVAFLTICVAGILWEIFCVLYISPFMHVSHWFENGICCFGQARRRATCPVPPVVLQSSNTLLITT